MINFDKYTIEFACPKCGFYNEIFFKQARLRDVVICRGCKVNIQLDDQMNECRKVARSVRRAGREFQESLKSLSNALKKFSM